LKQEAGLRLDTVASARKGGERGPALLAGRPAVESQIVRRITSGDPAVRMPQESKPLSAQEIATLTAWVEQGGVAPADEQPEADPRQHWSFQPVVRPPVPAVKRSDWVRNPIDAFLGAEHEKRNLVPLPPADKATLLRRVTIDLTGLPPTREQLRSHLADASPDAYEKGRRRAARLAAYGERWGRHWMDVWRYSDWYGRRSTPDVMNSYPQIWRWRDWIVRSLNEDKGYDRMVVEMLAADEVAPTDEQNLPATGSSCGTGSSGTTTRGCAIASSTRARRSSASRSTATTATTTSTTRSRRRSTSASARSSSRSSCGTTAWPARPDPGPFVNYVYGAAYGPIASGRIRVFDEKLDAPTFVYNGGDERNVAKGKPPVTPGVPAALGGDPLVIKPVDLPAQAWYPGLRPFVQQEELAKMRAVVDAAEGVIVQYQAQLAAAEREWRIVQDDAAAAVRDPSAGRSGATPAAQLAVSVNYQAAAMTHRVGELNLRHAWAKYHAVEARIAGDNARFAGPRRRRARASCRAAPAGSSARSPRPPRSRNWRRRNCSCSSQRRAGVPGDRRSQGGRRRRRAAGDGRARCGAAARAKLPVESDQYTPLSPTYPKQSTGRRTALAKWIASPRNPLTARVAANHIWLRHFGSAIVPEHVRLRPQRQAADPPRAARLARRRADGARLVDEAPAPADRDEQRLPHGVGRPRAVGGGVARRRRSREPHGRPGQHVPLAVQHEAHGGRGRARQRARGGGGARPTMGGPDIDHAQGLTSNRRSLYFTIHGEQKMKMLELFDAAEVTGLLPADRNGDPAAGAGPGEQRAVDPRRPQAGAQALGGAAKANPDAASGTTRSSPPPSSRCCRGRRRARRRRRA
jgi:hypothetical protein